MYCIAPVRLLPAVVLIFTCCLAGCRPDAEVLPVSSSSIEVYFSPRGGCTEAAVREIDDAKTSVLVQAYSFTSAPIAGALVEAHK